MAKATWNAGNPAVKRILQEAKEMNENPCREFVAEPTEDNVFEWVFTLRGPDGTEYENGFYRGRILLQSNYPFAPPDTEFLTPNGRFETNKKICLSISSYHPENWHPTWKIKTVLTALRDFMATPGNNAIGAIEYPKEKRRQLAAESHSFVCPITGCAIRDDIERMNRSPPCTSVELPEVCKTTPVPTAPPADGAPAEQAQPAQEDAGGADAPAAAAQAAPAPAPEPAAAPAVARRAPQQQQQQAALVIEESFINKSILVVLMAILAIVAKKIYQNPDWLVSIF